MKKVKFKESKKSIINITTYRNLTISLTEKQAQKLKIKAAQNNLTMKSVVRDLIDLYLKDTSIIQ